MAQTKEEINQKQVMQTYNNTYNSIYDDLTENWENTTYLKEKFSNLNLENSKFEEWQKKNLQGLMLNFQHEYDASFQCFQESNNIKENCDALFEIANYYDNHNVNKKLAFQFYKLAVEKGSKNAVGQLVFFYQHGIGVEQDEEKAFEILEEHHSKRNNPVATANLAYFYERGIGVEECTGYAVVLYLNAIKQGNIDAIEMLVDLYETTNIRKIVKVGEIVSILGQLVEKRNTKENADKFVRYYSKLTTKQQREFYDTLKDNSPLLSVIEKCKNFNNIINYRI